MNLLTRSMVRHAHAVAREVGARVVLLSADVVEADSELSSLIEDVDFRTILVSRRLSFEAPPGWGDLCRVVRVPNIPMSRAGQIKLATLVASVERLVQSGDRIVWLTGLDGSNTIDTIIVLDLGREVEMFAAEAMTPIPPDVRPEVFERVLTIAGQLGLEGREGRPIGTTFVLGDSDTVLTVSRQLIMNPFQGYDESERNLLDPRLEETVKEFSALDGAFIVRGDGVLIAAGRYLAPSARPTEPLPLGLGARHESACAITRETAALAICISESTGTVSLFKGGRLLADLQKPRSGAGDEL